jgi:serine protease Do
VIEGEEEVTVIPHDRQFIEARLVGKDERRDLALLKIERSYPALELADSDDLQVGKRVVAIGNPLGFRLQ